MSIQNNEIADLFNKLADLLEIEGANPFRVRAYRNAGRVISGLSKNVSDLVKEKTDLTQLPGIGDDLAEKIAVIVKTGNLPLLKQVEKRLPGVLSELLAIEGLGPKRVQVLYKKLKIRSLKDLENAIALDKISKLFRFGQKTQEKIRMGMKNAKEYSGRIQLTEAIPIAENLLNYLKKSPDVDQAEAAGSFRRRRDTIGDLDIVVSSSQPKKVIEHFVNFDEVAMVISKGSTRSTIRLRSAIQVDLRVVSKDSYGAALLYFTGSKSHNIALRKIALKKKLKLNEYGLFKGKKQIAGKTEEEIYTRLGLKFIEPTLREDHGEIELADANLSQA